MINVDDLTMISEQDLFVASGIPPGKICAIYTKAHRMISDVHVASEGVILEMEAMKREWKVMVDNSS